VNAAVGTVARSELRKRWVSMLVLGLLAGLVGSVVAGASAVSRRTATAYDRLVAATHLDDARVLVFSDDIDVDRIAHFPGVTESWQSQQVIGQLVGPQIAYVSVSSGPPRPDTIFSPVILAGRAPRDDAADEVLLPSVLADELGLRVGDHLALKLLTPLEVTQFDTGFGEPDGPAVDLRIVGIARVARTWVGGGVGPVIGSPALQKAYPDSQIGHNILVRLADGPAGVPAFDRTLRRLADRTASGEVGQEFGTLQSSYPTSETDPEVTAATSTLVGGQLVFIGLALLGGLLALGQGLARHHAVGAVDQGIEAALGLTRGERVLARVLPAILGAAVAATLTVAGSLLAGLVEPLGPLRQYEPEPGWLPDLPSVVGGAALTAAAFLLLAAVTAARVVRTGTPTSPTRRPAAGLSLLGRRAPALAGMAFALRGGHRGGAAGRGSVPVRATLAVTVLGVCGVVAVATFSHSLDRLADTPARYGWAADFAILDSKPFDMADLARDPRVEAIVDTSAVPVRIDDRRMEGIALRPLKGDVPLTVISGRLPSEDDEVALGSRDALRLGASVGSTVPIATYDTDGAPTQRSLRVVGLVIVPAVDEGLGRGAVLTARTLAAAGRSSPFTTAIVDARDSAAGSLYDELAGRLEMIPASQPAEVRNLVALGRLPVVLAIFLGALAVAVLVHSLVLTTRRRAPDLAVLRVIGLTPAQVGGALVTMALTIGVVGLALGPALGLAVGRVVWGEVATGIGTAGDPAIPWLVLVLAVPAVLVGTVLSALLPARRAATLRPAAVLRSE
jgi:putative ABC transport system permease protein